MPFIFGLPKLNLIQTLGLSVLINMLTSKPQFNTQTSEKSIRNDGTQVYDEYIKMREEVEQSLRK